MKPVRNLHMLLPLCLWLLAGCTKQFESINTDPNNALTTRPEYLMSQVLITTAYEYQKDAYYNEPASAGRYITLTQNEGADKFGWGPMNWDGHYGRLSVNKIFGATAEAAGQDQYVAISRIMRAFNFAYITDLFGDIPYSEALLSKDEQLIHPKYDAQQDIYPDLLKELKEANDQLAATKNAIDKEADVIYGGSVLKWRKLANSLRLRLLLRCSRKYAAAFAEMQEIVNDKAKFPIFESNGDNAEVKYLGLLQGNSWPGGLLANKPVEFQKRKPSKEVVDRLLAWNDPRLKVWIAPVAEPPTPAQVDKNMYVGVPNAIVEPMVYNGGDKHISYLAPIFNANADPLVKASLITCTEVFFILAEAVQQGKITVAGETAESLYYKAIDLSMEYWKVKDKADENSRAYYQQPAIKYDGTLKQLIVQKWMSLFLKGAEGWFEHRRTGFPKFVLGPAAAQRTIPKRYMYPLTESAYNRAQYQQALARFGEDSRNTLMWYLK